MSGTSYTAVSKYPDNVLFTEAEVRKFQILEGVYNCYKIDTKLRK